MVSIEIKKALLETVLLNDGRRGYVFTTLEPDGIDPQWECHVCCRKITSERAMGIHLSHPLHASKLRNLNHPASQFTKFVNHEKSPAGPPPNSSGPRVVPGEPVPPGMEDVIQSEARIQKSLDGYRSSPIIGLEYIVELTSDDGSEPRYTCVLCNKTCDPRVILVHITSLKHSLKYISCHFRKAGNDLTAAFENKDTRRGVSVAVEKIAKEIENRFGRLKPISTDSEHFNRRKEAIIRQIEEGPHFRDSPNFNLCEYTNPKQIEEYIRQMDQPIQVASGEVTIKDFSDEKPLDIKQFTTFGITSKNGSGDKKLSISIGKPTKPGLSERQNSIPVPGPDLKNNLDIIEIKSLSSVSSSPSPPPPRHTRRMEDHYRHDRKRSRDRSPIRRSPLRRRRSPSPAFRRRFRSRSRDRERDRRERLRRRSPDIFSRDMDRDHFRRRSPDYDRRRRLSPVRERSMDRDRNRRRKSSERDFPPEYQRAHAIHREEERAKRMNDKVDKPEDSKESGSKKPNWGEFRDALEKLNSEMEEKLKYYLHRPEKHPSYSEEWKMFWNRRYKEIQLSGQDPSKYDFKPEWILFWDKRMKELHEEDLVKKREELKISFALDKQGLKSELQDISPPTPENMKNITLDDVKNTWKQLTGNDIKGPPEKRRSISPWEDDDNSRLSRALPSPKILRESPPRSRNDFSPARSRNNYSPSRGRDLSPQRNRNSPVRHRNYASPSRGRNTASPPRGRSDLSPSRNRRHSPGRNRSDYSPSRSRREFSETRGSDQSPKIEAPCPPILHCLRLCSVLEPQLGSLGPRVLELLSQALSLDKVRESACMSLLRKPEVQILFETVKEKIKGQLSVQIVPRNFVRASKDAIKAIEHMLANYKHEPSPPPETPIRVESVGMVDKVAIAQQIAAVLISQGKTDVTTDELEGLINAVVGMAEASKANVTHASASNFLSNINLSDALLGNSRIHQLLSSVITSSQKVSEPPAKPEPVVEQNRITNQSSTPETNPGTSFTDDELRDKLLKFREMSRSDQNNLIALLKEIEATQPQRVENLRKYAASLINEPPKVENVNEPKPSQPAELTSRSEQPKGKIDDNDDDDDYSYEEVYKAASAKLNQKNENIRKNETISNQPASNSSSNQSSANPSSNQPAPITNPYGITPITKEFFIGSSSEALFSQSESEQLKTVDSKFLSDLKPISPSFNSSSLSRPGQPQQEEIRGQGSQQGNLFSNDRLASNYPEKRQGDYLPLLNEDTQFSNSSYPEKKGPEQQESQRFPDLGSGTAQGKNYQEDRYRSNIGGQKASWENKSPSERGSSHLDWDDEDSTGFRDWPQGQRTQGSAPQRPLNSFPMQQRPQSEFQTQRNLGEFQPQRNLGEFQSQRNVGDFQSQRNVGDFQSQRNLGGFQSQRNPGEFQPQRNPGEFQSQQRPLGGYPSQQNVSSDFHRPLGGYPPQQRPPTDFHPQQRLQTGLQSSSGLPPLRTQSNLTDSYFSEGSSRPYQSSGSGFNINSSFSNEVPYENNADSKNYSSGINEWSSRARNAGSKFPPANTFKTGYNSMYGYGRFGNN